MDGQEHGPAMGPEVFGKCESAPRKVFVRDLVALAHIGVHDHEKGDGQRVRLNIELEVIDDPDHGDRLENVVCYERLIGRVEAILRDGHVNLAETLAERIAAAALTDSRVLHALVRVEKLDAVPGAESVGVEILRSR